MLPWSPKTTYSMLLRFGIVCVWKKAQGRLRNGGNLLDRASLGRPWALCCQLKRIGPSRKLSDSIVDAGVCVEDQSDDEAVETQNFGENQNEDHTDEQPWLLGSASHTGVTDDSNGESSGKTGKTDRKTSTELNEASVEGHWRCDYWKHVVSRSEICEKVVWSWTPRKRHTDRGLVKRSEE
jgi:hypothetical protein